MHKKYYTQNECLHSFNVVKIFLVLSFYFLFIIAVHFNKGAFGA